MITLLTMEPTYEPIGQVLTPDEYDALPENPRRELVDGVVHVMATPTSWHQDVAFALRTSLRSLSPPELRVLAEIEVRLAGSHRRNPNVLAIHAGAYGKQRSRYQPSEVVLAVEVVSPGSESTDREVKPCEYAAGGIEHFWRVEIDPRVVVHTFRLGDHAAYVPSGVFTSGDVVNAPGLTWAKVTVADLNEA